MRLQNLNLVELKAQEMSKIAGGINSNAQQGSQQGAQQAAQQAAQQKAQQQAAQQNSLAAAAYNYNAQMAYWSMLKKANGGYKG